MRSKMISAILPKGKALNLIERLRREKDVNTANLNRARGTGKMTPIKYRDTVVEKEKEILTIVVEEERSEEIFRFIYEAADINRPHGGLVYMHKLLHSSSYELPDISEEEH
jgi:nitrogen regulatory protein PII